MSEIDPRALAAYQKAIDDYFALMASVGVAAEDMMRTFCIPAALRDILIATISAALNGSI